MTKTERIADAPHHSIDDLIAVMAALRTPLTGCPWDLEQTFATIAPYTLEEAYEVADAIERGDMDNLEEELGDLLLQVVYHARMAEEAGSFRFAHVVDRITAKMIRRHPHVFGDETARSAGAVTGLWDRIKAEEKAEKTGRPCHSRCSSLHPCRCPRGVAGAGARDQVAGQSRQGRIRLAVARSRLCEDARGTGRTRRGRDRRRSARRWPGQAQRPTRRRYDGVPGFD